MRLLPKQEADQKRAEEMRQKMDEGLRISGRVDSLRETLASEEVAFEKYRRDVLSGIRDEITALSSERDTVSWEVTHLKKEREEAMKPVEVLRQEAEKRIEELHVKASEIVDRVLELNTKFLAVSVKENELSKKENDLSLSLRKSALDEIAARERLDKATKESERLRIEGRVLIEEALSRVAAVVMRESDASAHELSIEKRETNVAKRETKIAKQEASLKARWEILKKSANRLTNKK